MIPLTRAGKRGASALTYSANAGGHSMLCPYKPVGARKRRFQTPLRVKPVALAE